jgi:hypothetical protein
MPGRSLIEVDAELSSAVKDRGAARQAISRLSADIVRDTRCIDQLLAERSALIAAGAAIPTLVQ